MKPKTLVFQLVFLCVFSIFITSESTCKKGCNLALASYYVWDNITFVAKALANPLINPANQEFTDILNYNPNISSKDAIPVGARVHVPFPCDCLETLGQGKFLGHTFQYNLIQGDTYDTVAHTYYANLTTVEWLRRFNTYPPERLPDNAVLNVTINCSCGYSHVSDYGLFVTYPLRAGDSLRSLARETGVEENLLQRYNPGVDFSRGSGIVYVPGRDRTGNYPRLSSSKGLERRVIAGISVAVVLGVLLSGGCAYMFLVRNKKQKKAKLLSTPQDPSNESLSVPAGPTGGASSPTGITVDKSVEFSYEELAKATDNFSMANKIGQGGFGAVYYAELRGEKAAIKKMNMQASKEFYAELKVLTRVHHVNLVRLIGYCVDGSLFLVYEFIENGTLSQHLRGSGRNPLPWSSRVKIALDSARGLEYIHEHTVPVYTHRDIKSANILIDKNFRGKVADFGLAKLTEAGATTGTTANPVGTFGYMAPEYARYGEVSAKVDVFSFGVVLYELISAKAAITRLHDFTEESKGLVAVFEDVLNRPDPEENLCKLVDPRLGDSYPYDEVYKMAQIAKACTDEEPQRRPTMRSVVVYLMTLSSSTGNWDVGAVYENQYHVNLMSGR